MNQSQVNDRRSFLGRVGRMAGAGIVLGRTDAAPGVISAKVLDAETGQIIPCTVTMRTSKGEILTDHPSFSAGFRSSGQFEKAVPPGETTITVSQGFDREAVLEKLELGPGERKQLTFELRPRAGLRRRGWYCGDNHVHMIHGEREITADFAYIAQTARAAGLDYMSLAQLWSLPSPTPKQLEQVCAAVSTQDFQLSWNMEAPKNYWKGDVSRCLGHGWTLAMSGYTAGGQDAITEIQAINAGDYETEKTPTPNFETHALVHSLGGIVSYTHPTRESWEKWGGEAGYPVQEHKFVSNLAQELPFDTVVGPTYDTIDILMTTQEKEVNEKSQRLWFTLLNHGYRIAATASTDSCFDRPGDGDPGSVRVYTHVKGQPELSAIAAAMKSHRNFVTSGPLLLFEVDPYQIGDVVPVSSPLTLKARVTAWASGKVGEFLTRLEVIRNGEVVKTVPIDGRKQEFALEWDLHEGETAWYVARCWGSSEDEAAITNPIYFEGKDYQRPEPTRAQVTAAVKDKATGAPLAGSWEVIRRIGLSSVTDSRSQFEGGKLSLSVPGTARIRVNVPGYIPEEKSVFIDYKPVLDLVLDLHSEQVIDWSTFEKIKSLLGDVQLEFALTK